MVECYCLGCQRGFRPLTLEEAIAYDVDAAFLNIFELSAIAEVNKERFPNG